MTTEGDDSKGDRNAEAEPERESSAVEPSERSEPPDDGPVEAPAVKASDSPKARRKSKSKSKGPAVIARSAPWLPLGRAVLVAVVALGVGGAAGWFGHEAQAKAKLRAESQPAAAGSASASGPCGDWEKKVCAGGGPESAACLQAKGAVALLTPSTCEIALEAMPATLAKVKAARVPCDNLVAKLCKDLSEGSSTCQMVTQRTASFPAERCQEMLQHYDEVLGQLKAMEQQMRMPMGAHPGPGPN